ncbi:hypothetical protein [Brachybacterium sacelli]|uniref:DUF308 domain-containing protein n=1 Tax=Brachybacterium sacelli TaxID=173364 RepID=A0ABS4X2D5_9MICO|nr:hypothetical protein [Brachybacterium sacelli]MBP2382626.1 hypothetical protein [Brachybacterium sacelli]
MTSDRGSTPDPRDVDAEFARMLEDEGMVLRPGEAPREPAAPEGPESPRGPSSDDDFWSPSAESPPEPPSEESRARSRAAHPAAGGSDGIGGLRGAAGPRELDDDEVLYGDFEPPDPDLPQPSSGTLWSWTALIGGFVLLVASSVSPALPGALGWVGALAAVGGVVSLLLRVPGSRDGDDDGAEV